MGSQSPRRLPRFPTFVFLCAAGFAAQVAARNLPFLGIQFPEPVETFLRVSLMLQSLGELFQFIVLPVNMALGAGVLALFLLRRRRCIRREEEGAGSLAPWLQGLLWLELLLNNYAFDASPHLAALCSTSLLALSPRLRVPLLCRARSIAARGAVAGLLVAIAAWLAIDIADALAFVVWAGMLGLLVALDLRGRDRLVLALLLIPGVQLLAGALPLAVALHDGQRIGEGTAYSFCESAKHEKVFAAIQTCVVGASSCLDSHIVEHDRRDLSKQVRHYLFDRQFVGRPQYLVCLDDVVQVGMNETIVDGASQDENVMEFEIGDPRRFRPNVIGPGAGYRLAHDRRHDAIFYVSEWTHHIFRYDRRSDVLDRGVGDAITRRGQGADRYVVGNTSIHEGRGSIFFGSLIGGVVLEVDLASLGIVRRFPVADGMFLFPTVDEEKDRLWIAGHWGVTVLDLETGRLLLRQRLGHFNRSPVVDPTHDLVFLSSTLEGKIRILDRTTFEFLGTIPIGLGPRVPFVSPETGRLLAGSTLAYYAWQTSNLALRLRGRK